MHDDLNQLEDIDVVVLRRLLADACQPEHDDDCPTCVGRRQTIATLTRLLAARAKEG